MYIIIQHFPIKMHLIYPNSYIWYLDWYLFTNMKFSNY